MGLFFLSRLKKARLRKQFPGCTSKPGNTGPANSRHLRHRKPPGSCFPVSRFQCPKLYHSLNSQSYGSWRSPRSFIADSYAPPATFVVLLLCALRHENPKDPSSSGKYSQQNILSSSGVPVGYDMPHLADFRGTMKCAAGFH
jgi:hypothetical protein